MVMPGDNVSLEIELITPIACEEGLRFAIREGGRTVGAGVVTKILPDDAEARRRSRRQVQTGTRGSMAAKRNHHPRVHRLPGAQLLHDEEQARQRREAGAFEVLPLCRKHTKHKETK